ncbi:cytochrome P450 2U1-like [Branchiostoma floridae x Branchiostoma japonicum]
MEILRIRAILPLNLPHATNEDTTFRGYDIPAGTQVLPNLWSANMDPEYWSDPEKFDPVGSWTLTARWLPGRNPSSLFLLAAVSASVSSWLRWSSFCSFRPS